MTKVFLQEARLQTMSSKGIQTGLCVALVALVAAGPAHAIRCNAWVRLNSTQRVEALQANFRSILKSARASNWATVNKTRTNQCLNQQMPRIASDFDEQCSKGLRVPVDILDQTLMGYVRSCATW